MKERLEAIAIGVSAGGLEALLAIIPRLPQNYSLSVFVVQHMGEGSDRFLSDYLNEKSEIRVKEAEDKETIEKGRVYIAPSGYHLLIEEDKTFGLSVDPRINYARPSIDVLFESAAEAYFESLIGVVLTGASSDGTKGLKKIKELGGLTLVQDPSTAKADVMPRSAIAATHVDHVLPLKEIGEFLGSLTFAGSYSK